MDSWETNSESEVAIKLEPQDEEKPDQVQIYL